MVENLTRTRTEFKKPMRFDEFVMMVAAEINHPKEPLSYKEAIACSEQNNWRLAMEQEMQSLKENCTWVLTKLPSNKKTIPCKWVYNLKTNPYHSIDKYKARLVIKGYSQRKGEYYEQTFSRVAKDGTIRTVLSVAASKNMSLTQFDVCAAFLYGMLDEKVYMK